MQTRQLKFTVYTLKNVTYVQLEAHTLRTTGACAFVNSVAFSVPSRSSACIIPSRRSACNILRPPIVLLFTSLWIPVGQEIACLFSERPFCWTLACWLPRSLSSSIFDNYKVGGFFTRYVANCAHRCCSILVLCDFKVVWGNMSFVRKNIFVWLLFFIFATCPFPYFLYL